MILVESKAAAPIAPARAASCVLVILAGGTAPTPLAQALGCSLLDIEVAPGTTLLDWWAGRDWCPVGEARHVRTTRGAGSAAPSKHAAAFSSALIVHHQADAHGPRGSAGAIRDACEGDAVGTTIIAAESSTALLAPLEPMVAGHAESGADVTLVTTTTGRPAGLAIIERRALDLVKPRGFVDFKEQLLPALVKAGRRVNLVEVLEEEAIPMHDRQGLLDGMRRIAASIEAQPDEPPIPLIDPRWGPSLLSREAAIDPSAMVTASVVLGGARIGAEAIVARSVIAPGAVIGPGEVVIDRLIAADPDALDEHPVVELRRGRR